MEPKEVTRGFRLNHIGLRVADLERSIDFYSGVFGMKELTRMPLDTFTVAFLGYSDPAVPDGPLFAREGVLELVCPKTPKKADNSSGHPDSSFVKLGFSVPDMGKANEYLASRNIKIHKEAGTARGSEVVTKFLGSPAPEEGYDKVLWEAAVNVIFAEDPDGYLIELIPY